MIDTPEGSERGRKERRRESGSVSVSGSVSGSVSVSVSVSVGAGAGASASGGQRPQPQGQGILPENRRGTRLWKYRPFSRVVRGWRAYKIVRDYIQLNEQEILGKIPYRKERLRGMSSSDWEVLWA